MNSEQEMKEELECQLFSVQRSIRYHDQREAFFSRCHKSLKVVCLLAGMSAITAVFAEWEGGLLIIGVIVAASSALEIVFEFAKAASKHRDLKRRFVKLAAEFGVTEIATKENLKRLWSKRLTIEADEPPVLRVLNCICHNQTVRSLGCDEKEMVRIEWWQRWFSNMCDLPPSDLKKQCDGGSEDSAHPSCPSG